MESEKLIQVSLFMYYSLGITKLKSWRKFSVCQGVRDGIGEEEGGHQGQHEGVLMGCNQSAY